MKKIILLLFPLSVLIFSFTACTMEESHHSVTNQAGSTGNLVMIGGGPRPAEIMQLIVSLSPDSSILVVPMASGIPDTIGWEHRDQFYEYGAKHVTILMMEPGDDQRKEIVEKVRNARGIWFSGGDQNKLMEYFGSEEIREAVREAWRNGAVIAGTSAGTAVQSKTMITGDEKYPLPRRFNWFSQVRHDNVIVSEGFGLVENMIVDQHFIRRNRLNRLVNVLLDNEEQYAVGIDEATALWFKPNGEVEVVGESQVMILEAPNVAAVVSDSLLAARDIRFHILTPGSTFQWQNNRLSDIRLR